MNGNENPIMKDVRAFAEALQQAAAVSVYYEPEFYTSQEARRHTGKSVVDAEAATIILNSYLSKKRHT
jgi:RNase H-fold protein (predicted Holliday junction resolvase)